MFVLKHQNAAGSRITVTNTATNIYDLINAAASTSFPTAGFPIDSNGIDISVEDGSIRILWEDNVPTANNGQLLTPGIYFFRNMPLSKLKLIRAGATNVVCSVQVGRCLPGEISAAASAGGGTGTSASQTQGNVAAGSTDSGNPVKVGGVYNTTKPTYTNGQRGDFQIDSNGDLYTVDAQAPNYEDQTNNVAAMAVKPLSVATYDWSAFQNLGANATLNVKAAAGNVYSLYCHNLNGAARWIQLHNTATTPSGGAVPIYSFLIPAGGTILIDGMFFGLNGKNFTTGIAFAFSTTEGTYTAGTASDQFTFIQYK